jgi:BASS family bile acid:Na+ symporter
MLRMVVPTAVLLLMVSVGMGLDLSQLLGESRRLGAWAWLRLLLFTFVVPPAIALLLARLFGFGAGETAGLFLVGAAPGAPLLTRNIARKGFDRHLAASYQVWSALLTPLAVPVVVWAAARLYDRDVWIPPLALLAQVARQQLLPLAGGMALMALAPGFSRRVERPLNVAGNALLVAGFAVVLVAVGPALARASPWVPVAAALLAVASMATVRLLLQVDDLTEQTLAICNANRHVGLALLISGRYLHAEHAVPAVASYALIAPLLMALYARRLKLVAAPDDAA